MITEPNIVTDEKEVGLLYQELLKRDEAAEMSNIIDTLFALYPEDYSHKNNLGYWTENKDNDNKYMCNKCLIGLYNDKFRYWSMITNPKKKQRMKTYIYTGAIFLE